MKIAEAEGRLRSTLKARGLLLKNLTAEQALDLGVDFWLKQPIEGVLEEKGDGVAAYVELVNEGRGNAARFGVNRLLRVSEGFGFQPAYRVDLFTDYKPTQGFFQLQSPVACFKEWNRANAAEFLLRVRSSPGFGWLGSSSPIKGGIRFVETRTPSPLYESSTSRWEW